METRNRAWRFTTCLLLGLLLLATTLQTVQGEEEPEAPSQCKPFIEKALKEQHKEEVPADQEDTIVAEDDSEHGESEHDTADSANIDSTETQQAEEGEVGVSSEIEPNETEQEENIEIVNEIETETPEGEAESVEDMQADQPEAQASVEEQTESVETKEESVEAKEKSTEAKEKSAEVKEESAEAKEESAEATEESVEAKEESAEVVSEEQNAEIVVAPSEEPEAEAEGEAESQSQETGAESQETAESQEGDAPTDAEVTSVETQESSSVEEVKAATTEGEAESAEKTENKTDTADSAQDSRESTEQSVETEPESTSIETEDETETKSVETEEKPKVDVSDEQIKETEQEEQTEVKESVEEVSEQPETAPVEEEEPKESKEEVAGVEAPAQEVEDTAASKEVEVTEVEEQAEEESQNEKVKEVEDKPQEETEPEVVAEETKETVPEDDLLLDIEIPENLRPREHVDQLLKLDVLNDMGEALVNKVNDNTLKELKKLYENAIKPLETLYKYRDLSNRHFGDSEIFSKPLVVFMGPWSGGKSSIVNYLLDNEYNGTSLRTGAEPSPAYFNLVMHGNEPEVLDGTQLAADFTFSGLQKFGQGLEERLRGLKLPNKLLEKINIVEIPGILEVRKQVSRVFPFNDACQWFIDRADIIFLVYDPSKLDVGPETEAILDQLKGREHQTRIVLNKADQVKPEELMRVQSALIWNISPLMSSAQPPVMYTTSLWSRPYETWAPVRLLQAQERAFLRDLRTAVDKRIENKISSARRFAVRVRNHAKMVDCYLTTYYNHKSVFGNKKQVADQIIEHPQDYHIYEGLSTLTNISRYDLPDPEVYRDFFRLNPLYDFQQLSATCTYFRGCPINRLDVAIAYDLPELVGKHKKQVETALAAIKPADSS